MPAQDSGPVELSYTLGRDDFQRVLAAFERGRRGMAAFRSAVTLGCVVLVGLLVLLRIAEDGPGGPGVLYVLFVALFLTPALPAYSRRVMARRAAEAQAHQGPLRATISQDGVRITGRATDTRNAWSHYGSYLETPEAFILRSPDRRRRLLTPLPKRGLPGGANDAARLRALLDRHLPRD